MRIYHFEKHKGKNHLLYIVEGEGAEGNYHIQRLKAFGRQFHLKNMKGEVFCRISGNLFQRKKIKIYFDHYTIGIADKNQEYAIEYYRKNRALYTEGNLKRGSFHIIEEGRVLCTKQSNPLEDKEEWILYDKDGEECIALLFCIFYLNLF